MIKNLRISKKILIGLVPMVILLLGYLTYSLIKLNDTNKSLSIFKTQINQQATYGTSLFLLNNISRREQINQAYLASGQANLIDIIKLLEIDFSILNDEQLKYSASEQYETLNFISNKEQSYIHLVHEKLWPTAQKLQKVIEELNLDVGPNFKKLATNINNIGIQNNDINTIDLSAQLLINSVTARADFNEYITDGNNNALNNALLEITAAESVLDNFTDIMKSEDIYNYNTLLSELEKIKMLISKGQKHTETIMTTRKEAQNLSSSIINEMMSYQISQWRKLNYEAGTIQNFVKAFQWQSTVSLIISLILGITALVIISKLIIHSLNILLNRVSEISQGGGDLTKRVNIENKDETGELATSLNVFIGSIHEIIKNAQISSHNVIEKSKQNLTYATESSQLLKEQQENNQLVLSAVEQLAITSSEVAENSVLSSNAAEVTFSSLAEGIEIVDKSVQSVQQLNDQMEITSKVSQDLANETEAISKVLDVIKNMADQTNLLALNAAIEAARAGEAGRGFAVVADEIRTLANRTQTSTSEIDKSITRLQTESKRVLSSVSECYEYSAKSAEAADETQDVFAKVKTSVEQIHTMSISIAAASEEQSQVTTNIRQDMEKIFNSSESIAKSAQASQLASQDSTDSATQLNQVLTKFIV